MSTSDSRGSINFRNVTESGSTRRKKLVDLALVAYCSSRGDVRRTGILFVAMTIRSMNSLVVSTPDDGRNICAQKIKSRVRFIHSRDRFNSVTEQPFPRFSLQS